MKASTPSPNSLTSQIVSIPEPSGQTVSIQSETKLNAVHAGLSVPPKHLVTDSALPLLVVLMSSSPHKTSSLAIPMISDVKVVTSPRPGNSLPELVSSLMLVTHTLLVAVLLDNVRPSVPVQVPGPSTSPKKLAHITPQPRSKLLSSPVDPLKPVSPFMKISCLILEVSTSTLQVVLLEDMPSRSSVGELNPEPISGLLPTLGVLTGVKVVTLESNKDNAQWINKVLLVSQTLVSEYDDRIFV